MWPTGIDAATLYTFERGVPELRRQEDNMRRRRDALVHEVQRLWYQLGTVPREEQIQTLLDIHVRPRILGFPAFFVSLLACLFGCVSVERIDFERAVCCRRGAEAGAGTRL